MKFIVFIAALLVSSGAFSQSKKKQIEMLQHQLDSISIVNDSLEESFNRSEQKARFYKKQSEYHSSELNKILERFDLLVAEYEVLKQRELQQEIKPNSKTNVNSSSQNPFGDGRVLRGDVGSEYNFNPQRIRMNNVSVSNIRIKEDVAIRYKLAVDAHGNVVAFSYVPSNTTTTDLILINKIGVEIKKQLKYEKSEGAPLEYVFYKIHLKAK